MRASEFIVEVASTVTPERLEDLKKLYDSGTSNEEIAKLLDLNPSTVKKWLNTFYKDRVKRQTTSKIDVDVEQLKKLVDQGKTYREIAGIMGYEPDVMLKLIKNRYKDRTRKFTPVKMTPERLKDIKDAYDQGWSLKDIGELVGTSHSQIGNILTKYYPDRKPRIIHAAKAASPEDKTAAFDLWDSGIGIRGIAKKLGVDPDAIKNWLTDKYGQEAIDQEQERRRSTGGSSLRMPHKVTPEMKQKMRELYVTGMILRDIADALGNVVDPRTVLAAMSREPDFEELRAAREERTQAIKKRGPTTTNIHRPGTIGNLRSKGPGSKHTHGMFPSSKWGMYKP